MSIDERAYGVSFFYAILNTRTMKQILIYLAISLMCIPCSLMGQSPQKQVQMTITREIDGVKTVLDTSFMVNDADEVEAILQEMGIKEPGENQTLEKRIVIRDIEGEAPHHMFDFHNHLQPQAHAGHILGLSG